MMDALLQVHLGNGISAELVQHVDEQADLEKARFGIAQFLDALASGEFLLLVLAGDALLAAALAEPRFQGADLVAQLAESGGGAAALAYASCCCRSANHFFM